MFDCSRSRRHRRTLGLLLKFEGIKNKLDRENYKYVNDGDGGKETQCFEAYAKEWVQSNGTYFTQNRQEKPTKVIIDLQCNVGTKLYRAAVYRTGNLQCFISQQWVDKRNRNRR